MKTSKSPLLFGVAALGVGAALFVASGIQTQPVANAADKTENIGKNPAPVIKAKPGQSTATFAGGCFWSMQAMFEALEGVSSAQPGYAGGQTKNPTYSAVGGGDTGHAETIDIVYDPKIVSYQTLLDVFLSVHDPTQLNRQGADVGTNYRSEIFYRNPQQQELAQTAIAKPASAYGWDGKIVTQLAPYKRFYRAESYHLDYYNQNPTNGYCVAVVAPKIKKFKEKFGDKLKK